MESDLFQGDEDDRYEMSIIRGNSSIEYILRSQNPYSSLPGMAFLISSLIFLHFFVFAKNFWLDVLVILAWNIFALFRIESESVLIIQGVGLELKTRYYSGRESVQFIERTCILDVFLWEGLTRFQILYYIAVVVEGSPQLFVVFENLLPRLSRLKEVYWTMHELLLSDRSSTNRNNQRQPNYAKSSKTENPESNTQKYDQVMIEEGNENVKETHHIEQAEALEEPQVDQELSLNDPAFVIRERSTTIFQAHTNEAM